MKKIFILTASFFMTTGIWAQSPEKMSYQAVIRDVSGALLENSSVGFQISILQGSATGSAQFVETQTSLTNDNGLISLVIGSGTLVSGSMSGIDWSAGPYFLKTETDPNGGTSYTISGTSQMMTVPYTLHAAYADSAGVEGVVGPTGTAGPIGATGSPGSAGPTGPTGAASTSTLDFYLGQDTLGGIVYFLYKDAAGTQHGLIVSKTESTLAWQSTATVTGADRTEDGAYNTALLTNSPSATYVNSLGAGWYLPSIDELNLIYFNRYIINKASRLGGFTLLPKDSNYWSSTEVNSSQAFYFYSQGGYIGPGLKGATGQIRAVKAF